MVLDENFTKPELVKYPAAASAAAYFLKFGDLLWVKIPK
jgi:hypothetical protein